MQLGKWRTTLCNRPCLIINGLSKSPAFFAGLPGFLEDPCSLVI